MMLRPDPLQGPDYRLYKSEPELTTVAEVDESNGEEKSEQAVEKEPSATKGELITAVQTQYFPPARIFTTRPVFSFLPCGSGESKDKVTCTCLLHNRFLRDFEKTQETRTKSCKSGLKTLTRLE